MGSSDYIIGRAEPVRVDYDDLTRQLDRIAAMNRATRKREREGRRVKTDLEIAGKIQSISASCIAATLAHGAKQHPERTLEEALIADDHAHHIYEHILAYLSGDSSEEHLDHIMARAPMEKLRKGMVITTPADLCEPEGVIETLPVQREIVTGA